MMNKTVAVPAAGELDDDRLSLAMTIPNCVDEPDEVFVSCAPPQNKTIAPLGGFLSILYYFQLMNHNASLGSNQRPKSSPLHQHSIFCDEHSEEPSADDVPVTDLSHLAEDAVGNSKRFKIFEDDFDRMRGNSKWLQAQCLTLDYLPEKSRGFFMSVSTQKKCDEVTMMDDHDLSEDYQQCLQELYTRVFEARNISLSMLVVRKGFSDLSEYINSIFDAIEIKKSCKAFLYFENIIDNLNQLTIVDLQTTQDAQGADIRGLVSVIVILKVLESECGAVLDEACQYKVNSAGKKLIENNSSWLLGQSMLIDCLSAPVRDLLKDMKILPSKHSMPIYNIPNFENEYLDCCGALCQFVVDISRPDYLEIVKQYGYTCGYYFINEYFKMLSIEDSTDLSQSMSESLAWINLIIDVDLIQKGSIDEGIYDQVKDCVAALLIIKTLRYCFDGNLKQPEFEFGVIAEHSSDLEDDFELEPEITLSC